MAEKRMFSQKIIDSDAFIDMPLSTQAVYFHLSMRADDEGFINNPKKILRMIGASEDEIKLLIAKRFVLDMDSGVVVIKHWFVHNYIRKDRVKPTAHIKEKSKLTLQENDSYSECQTDVSQVSTRSQHRREEISLEEISLEEISLEEISLEEISLEEDKEIKTEVLTESQIDAKQVSEYLLFRIRENKPNFKQPNISHWENDIDKAIRLDGRTKDQLIECINWIYSGIGSFWIPNILSGKKLREKFDTMESQMMQSNSKNVQTMKNLKIAEDIYNAK